ncbi:MAG: hypothetical protein OI74_15000 [Gammaproteobacteria bacterium (ex Lamellibrachia satsuma)]|nr:MAG: DUF2939 domain-containing protein [Gammaproteobacteria bacterium (ex Lamellibrachia satsuma)]RRS31357.1 MAG: hypothetical protein OI74_15000 [Gammaproteobacteria bacterium (ex Lamellibrachia satsuma)]RRS36901.1 MAG: hypothetical protein NV67_03735 [Gammaproteobacteria bacterium (ex Lamellibrachia satsuma)]
MKSLLFSLFLLLVAYVVWPYTTVYQLDRTMQESDREAFAGLVDIRSIREQIKRKMNKDLESGVGDVSNEFVDWLQNGIQTLGSNAVEHLVDLDWAVLQLRAHNPDKRRGGFLKQLDYAFFDGPDSLLLRIGDLGDDPVHARLTLENWSWRVTAIYN